MNIKNREPFFILNNEFFYDKDLYQFKYDLSKTDLIMVEGPIDKPEEILKLIE